MFQLDLSQTFNVSVERLYEAWTQAESMQKWFCPGDMTVPQARADCRVGGQYQVVMQSTNGEQHIVSGEYKEVVPMEKLVFTWQWQDSPHTTLVTVLFNAGNDGGSELELNHSEFVDADARNKHNQGWQGCLSKLISTQTTL